MVANNEHQNDIRGLIKALADDLDHDFSVFKEGEVTVIIGSVELTITRKNTWYYGQKKVKSLE